MSATLESDLHQSYMLAAQAQAQRFDRAVPGVDLADTSTDEYRDYFGQGEAAGVGTEQRVTWRAWLEADAANRRAESAAREAWQASQDALPPEPDELADLQPWDLEPWPVDEPAAATPTPTSPSAPAAAGASDTASATDRHHPEAARHRAHRRALTARDSVPDSGPRCRCYL